MRQLNSPKSLVPLALLAFLSAAILSCGSPGGSANQSPANSVSNFQASAKVQQMGVGTNVQISVAGGTPPYSFSVTSGGGTVSSSGLYTASAVEGTVVIEASDSKNGAQDVSLNVGPSLSAGTATLLVAEGLSLTVFPTGGSPPYTYHVTGSGQATGGTNNLNETYVVYTAASAAGSDNLSITDGQGTMLNLPVTVHASPSSIYLWTTVADAGTAYRLTFDPSNNSFSSLQSVATPVATVLRGGAVAADGSFFTSSAEDLGLQKITSTFSLGSVVTLAPAGSVLTGAHALCVLPNGHFIVGDENDVNVGNIAEFTADGTFVSSLGTVGLPYVPANHPGMTNCQALSNKKVIFVADDTWGGTGGEAVEMDFVNGAWTVAQRVDFSALDTQLGTVQTSPWTMAVHSDGYVYMAPGLANGSSSLKMIRCPLSSFTAASCVQVGSQNLPFGTSWIYGLSQIPGSNDLLVSSSTALYRYNYNLGTYTSLCDVTSSAGSCFLDPSAYIRGFVMR